MGDAEREVERRLPEVEDVMENFPSLTPREMEAFLMVGQGMSNAEIAWEMGVKESTVRTWLKYVYSKLFIRGRGRLAVAASRVLNLYA